MVKTLLLALFFSSLISTQSYAGIVEIIDVQDSGIIYKGRSSVEKEGCRLFVPSKAQVVNFFNQAKTLPEGGAIEHEYYSPCIAIGKIVFKDGSTGRWTLQSSGFGYVTFEDQKTTYFFYKNNSWFDPFACTYGVGDEPKC
ncbi:hypothetical protein [Serratia rubidaea]|uniref:hypothetical protein n=1 Tax=Serratia rubidaea TaxID=61652 RepID=UPI0022B8ECDD|nr:hypothetical protein [Serratia rubidaea]WBF47639.1 hypothetical protein OLD77_11545 [Serratia rubidaea]